MTYVRAELWRDGEKIDETEIDGMCFVRSLAAEQGDVIYLVRELPDAGHVFAGPAQIDRVADPRSPR